MTSLNHKGFAIQAINSAKKRFQRKEDLRNRKIRIPLPLDYVSQQAPTVISVIGSGKVGKTTIIKNLISNFTKNKLVDVKGPFTLVTSKKQRVTLFECHDNMFSMIDIAKCTDIALLIVDASFGFELEIFEFLSICQTHGMPRIMGVLNHLDVIKNPKTLKRQKKMLKHRFWTEVYNGGKLFYLTGFLNGEYIKNEVKNLARFISVMKFRPIMWRLFHSYILVDRVEDITPKELLNKKLSCDRNIQLYGYVRGAPLRKDIPVHIPGYGDMKIKRIKSLPDPCPLPSAERKSLSNKEKHVYSPMSGVGGISFENDLLYVKLQTNGVANIVDSNNDKSVESEKKSMSIAINQSKLKLLPEYDVLDKIATDNKSQSNIDTSKTDSTAKFSERSTVFNEKLQTTLDKFTQNRNFNLMKLVYSDASIKEPFDEERCQCFQSLQHVSNKKNNMKPYFVASLWKTDPSSTVQRKGSSDKIIDDSQEVAKLSNGEQISKSHWIKSDTQFYDQLCKKVSNQIEVNRKEFSTLNDESRSSIQGFLPGSYVCIEVADVSYEFVQNFDPFVPIVIGGLNTCENNFGFLTAKIKKHRWYNRVMKSNTPLVISLGWRRFQTVPVFAKQEDDLKYRFLKYTPAHLSCSMIFFGPIAIQNSGLLIIDYQNRSKSKSEFRIAGTGSVSGFENTPRIVKKIKIVGFPYKIYEKSAFIKDMFSSSLEVTKFVGAKIKTVSGIRGQIKKSINEVNGAFRATFEDKILLTDIVFCRTWYQIKIPKFYSTVTNLLTAMDTLAKDKYTLNESKIKTETKIQTDSLYLPIVRTFKQPSEIKIPKKLQGRIPFKEKQKTILNKTKTKASAKKVFTIRSPLERKVNNFYFVYF